MISLVRNLARDELERARPLEVDAECGEARRRRLLVARGKAGVRSGREAVRAADVMRQLLGRREVELGPQGFSAATEAERAEKAPVDEKARSAMVQEKDTVDAINEAGSMMETGQLSNQFTRLIGSALRRCTASSHKMISKITERKSSPQAGKTVWCVVLKAQTIKKYGLEPSRSTRPSPAPTTCARATR